MVRNFLMPCLALLMLGGVSCTGLSNKEGQPCPPDTSCAKNEYCAQSKRFGKITRAAKEVDVLPQMEYPANSPVAKWGKLKVAPNKNGVRVLCDEQGNPVQLRGMSSHGLQWAGVAELTEENIKALRDDWKCNLFRIAFYVDEEGGYAYNSSHRTRHMENVVEWCGKYGIYVMVDWHVLNPGNPQHNYYRNHHTNGIDLAADFFTYAARRFQNQKHVIYELCNEPNPSYGSVIWEEDIKPYCEDMLKIIRSYDKDVICICGTPSWCQQPQQVIGKEPVDENGQVYGNLLYSFHFYAATHNDGVPDDPNIPYKGYDFITPFRHGDTINHTPSILAQLPIFVTEFGTTDASGWANFRADKTDMWLDLFDGANDAGQLVSWCNWSFSAEGGMCAALKWNDGNIGRVTENSPILTESGKYIFKRLNKYPKN